MPIHVILGKPGSGKSLYATSQLVRELVEGRRNVVTNLPLRPGRLNEYLQQRWPNLDCRMLQRLRILSDEEIREFWKYRGVDGDDGKDGVAYFLDEAHIAFNARDWATLGRSALHYLSQHRKLGDIVWPITQSPGNLDKQFRSVAEDFTVLRNEYTAKYWIFKGRGRFVRRTYNTEPAGSKSEPFEVAAFSLDKDGLASCYDTAKGIGVHGSKADIGRRAKGLSIWWVFPMALAVLSMAFLLPWFLGRTAQNYLGGGAKGGAMATLGKLASGEAARIAKSDPEAGTVREPNAWDIPADTAPERPLWVRGWVKHGRQVNVVLSDGRVLTEADGSLAAVETNHVRLTDGRRIWLLTAASPAHFEKPTDVAMVPPAAGVEVPSAEAESDRTETGGTGAEGGSRLPDPLSRGVATSVPIRATGPALVQRSGTLSRASGKNGGHTTPASRKE